MTAAKGYQEQAPARPRADLPLVGQLLAHAATSEALCQAGRRFAWRSEGHDEAQFRWLLEAGMGPLLHRAVQDGTTVLPAAWREQLLSADLTARIEHGNRVDCMLEIIEVCKDVQAPVTLLKGISVGEQFYPSEHLRRMSDIDVLIAPDDYAHVEAALMARGFNQLDYPSIEGHHHGAPLVHARRRTVIELHTSLFDDHTEWCEGSLFSRAGVSRRSCASHYHGQPVRRLVPEMQLTYIAASFFNDLSLVIHPSYIASMFDAIYLLRACGSTLDWTAMVQWIDNPMARASLCALAGYLPRFGIAAPPLGVLERLATEPTMDGPLQLRLIRRMLDRHLVGGRPWSSLLPAPVPGRYSPARQFRKRVLGRLRARPETT